MKKQLEELYETLDDLMHEIADTEYSNSTAQIELLWKLHEDFKELSVKCRSLIVDANNGIY